VPSSLMRGIIAEIRKRKGLPPEIPPPSDFIDNE
jgi:hypothetical protein